MAVSYTHLDVYKRQVKCNRSGGGQSAHGPAEDGGPLQSSRTHIERAVFCHEMCIRDSLRTEPVPVPDFLSHPVLCNGSGSDRGRIFDDLRDPESGFQ